jgi:hypothetical protein
MLVNVGYVYRKAGAEGLRDLLTHHDGVTREFILDVAAGEVPVATTWHMPFMASSFAAQVLLAWSLPELRQLQWSARRRYGS